MSLTSLITIPRIREILAPLVELIPRPARLPIQIPPQTKNCSLVGTAFDYLFRFELKRRRPTAVDRGWVVETQVDVIGFLDPIPGVNQTAVRAVTEKARAALATFQTLKTVTVTELIDLARHAMRLANVEAMHRADRLIPGWAEVEEADIADLVELMELVPWRRITSKSPILLNPAFPHVSPRVRGADADLLAGDCLIDLKVIQDWISVHSLRQIVGYYLVARAEQRDDPSFAAPRRLGLYLARHGLLWVFPTDVFLKHAEFQLIEEQFWTAVTDLCPLRSPIPLPSAFPTHLTPPLTSLLPEGWKEFASEVTNRPDLFTRWGWPSLESVHQIAQVLGLWMESGTIPKMKLTPHIFSFITERVGGMVINRSSSWPEPPILPGTVIRPGGFTTCSPKLIRRLKWERPPEPRQRKPTTGLLGIPGDFPGLVAHDPAAAWDFFLTLVDSAPPSGDGIVRRREWSPPPKARSRKRGTKHMS